MEGVYTGINGRLVVYVFLSVLSLSSLRGVRSCGGHNTVVLVLAWARYKAVCFVLRKTYINNPAGSFWRFDQLEGVNLPTGM